MSFPALALEGDIRRIPDDISYVDLDGDGRDEFIVRAMATAPDGEMVLIISFYKRDEMNKWVPLPLKREGGAVEQGMKLPEGQDCRLNEVYYVSVEGQEHRKILLVRRTLGAGEEEIAPQSPVRLEYYALARDDNPIPGQPALFLRFEQASVTEQDYCHASEAVEGE